MFLDYKNYIEVVNMLGYNKEHVIWKTYILGDLINKIQVLNSNRDILTISMYYHKSNVEISCFGNKRGASVLTVNNHTKNIEVCKYYKIANCRSRLHNFNYPALIFYDRNGCKRYEAYYVNGKLHNPIGPAIRIFKDGVWENIFYINDIMLLLDTFCNKNEKLINHYKNNL